MLKAEYPDTTDAFRETQYALLIQSNSRTSYITPHRPRPRPSLNAKFDRQFANSTRSRSIRGKPYSLDSTVLPQEATPSLQVDKEDERQSWRTQRPSRISSDRVKKSITLCDIQSAPVVLPSIQEPPDWLKEIVNRDRQQVSQVKYDQHALEAFRPHDSMTPLLPTQPRATPIADRTVPLNSWQDAWRKTGPSTLPQASHNRMQDVHSQSGLLFNNEGNIAIHEHVPAVPSGWRSPTTKMSMTSSTSHPLPGRPCLNQSLQASRGQRNIDNQNPLQQVRFRPTPEINEIPSFQVDNLPRFARIPMSKYQQGVDTFVSHPAHPSTVALNQVTQSDVPRVPMATPHREHIYPGEGSESDSSETAPMSTPLTHKSTAIPPRGILKSSIHRPISAPAQTRPSSLVHTSLPIQPTSVTSPSIATTTDDPSMSTQMENVPISPKTTRDSSDVSSGHSRLIVTPRQRRLLAEALTIAQNLTRYAEIDSEQDVETDDLNLGSSPDLDLEAEEEEDIRSLQIRERELKRKREIESDDNIRLIPRVKSTSQIGDVVNPRRVMRAPTPEESTLSSKSSQRIYSKKLRLSPVTRTPPTSVAESRSFKRGTNNIHTHPVLTSSSHNNVTKPPQEHKTLLSQRSKKAKKILHSADIETEDDSVNDENIPGNSSKSQIISSQINDQVNSSTNSTSSYYPTSQSERQSQRSNESWTWTSYGTTPSPPPPPPPIRKQPISANAALLYKTALSFPSRSSIQTSTRGIGYNSKLSVTKSGKSVHMGKNDNDVADSQKTVESIESIEEFSEESDCTPPDPTPIWEKSPVRVRVPRRLSTIDEEGEEDLLVSHSIEQGKGKGDSLEARDSEERSKVSKGSVGRSRMSKESEGELRGSEVSRDSMGERPKEEQEVACAILNLPDGFWQGDSDPGFKIWREYY
ncbi:hypothetical protein TREMEDRAFT_58311 [Tremella mesenterica DSM 1558]|uniref:uncharacterized protein n=1 Tax=Tremella mesenterica (strain ATCC 24925 / CBS 8224 / DSM 1558 / NBRC 9311 / NRRL Y-6157 / RJB 2259-6 / UBC 559-6) TaxID=578456 RepID=UPI0003F496B7|nr:uncharacterized protein TREMEDRAFT_58311 [Tremella mesenterica DSM 1558]EIW72156.1 hypothetical protein TREMEDRAFT_58311 [Tremella mesenterica DSM 1558]